MSLSWWWDVSLICAMEHLIVMWFGPNNFDHAIKLHLSPTWHDFLSAIAHLTPDLTDSVLAEACSHQSRIRIGDKRS